MGSIKSYVCIPSDRNWVHLFNWVKVGNWGFSCNWEKIKRPLLQLDKSLTPMFGYRFFRKIILEKSAL